ncbi:UDP-N-acetylenolpyruvoylglucosamine reductase [Escherichia coli]|uniref:UDP-N-acetylenolpyruvoylglucosamine reductase n=1 Tax=Escherichia coli TaxID=562 RepID=A0A377KEL4_ECOLX|nr:UDP-N-acetylenolpyruvoylglucosamine reductase [Escherichia coli]
MNHSLKPWNTFGIDHNAQHIVCAEDEQQLLNAWQHATAEGQPVLILGEGSNVLFLEDYRGTVIINRIKGIEIHDEPDAWYLHVGPEKNWHRLVKIHFAGRYAWSGKSGINSWLCRLITYPEYWCLWRRITASCAYVDCVELATGKQVRLTAKECRFGYRDSIFKHEYQDRFAIVAVGLRLPKEWQPVLTYGDLTRLDPTTVTPQQVFDAVCHMRTTKLPDPKVNGNTGSFFKNPVVSAETANALLAQFPTAPHYPQVDGSVKLAAGWLIDQCQLKGTQIGGAAVHRQQALVLINEHDAKSEDVVQLAHHVRQKVGEKFNVWLEPEVRFIGASGEVSAVETIS